MFDHRAARKPTNPTIPATATGTCVGTAAPFFVLVDATLAAEAVEGA